MKNAKRNLLAALAAFVLMATTLNSCKPDEHNHDGQETITTLKVKLTPSGGTEQVYTFRSLNGSTTKDAINLSAGVTYSAVLELLDETKSPAEDITDEIKSEATEHQFFFTASPSGLVAISNFDKDSNGKDLGVTSTWVAGNAQTGTLKVVLKHLDDDPKTGDPTKGETDIEVLFDVTVQ